MSEVRANGKPATRYDVIVVGGGPGGATTACYLADRGRSVLLLEKEQFPRFHIGEGLLPSLWDIWDELGFTDELKQAGFVVKQGVRFSLFNADRDIAFLAGEFPDVFPRPTTFHVERARYDAMLLDLARRKGATIHQGWTVQDVCFDGTRAVGVVASPEGGEPTTITASVIVDATGRNCLLARRMGWRTPDPKLNKVSYFTHYRGAERVITDGTVMTDIHTMPGGWVWYIPLGNDIVSVGVVLDAQWIKDMGAKGLQARFDKALAGCPRVMAQLENAEQVIDVQTISNISYLNDRFVGDGFVLVGDASMFLDPIFSAGVTLAMRSAKFAAETIDAALEAGDVSAARLQPYEDRIRKPMSRIFKMIYNWYKILADKDPNNIFFRSLEIPWVRERLVIIFSGGYERADLDEFLAAPMLEESGAV